jgi:hypothetical protein
MLHYISAYIQHTQQNALYAHYFTRVIAIRVLCERNQLRLHTTDLIYYRLFNDSVSIQEDVQSQKLLQRDRYTCPETLNLIRQINGTTTTLMIT